MVGYHRSDSGLTSQKKLVAGCVSGVLTRFVTQPVDIVKLRTQLQRRSAAMMHKTRWYPTFKRILREEGFYGFFAGHCLGQLHSIMSVSSQFYFFELATTYTYSLFPDGKNPPWMRFVCGIFAGCCSTTLVLPIEVIRVRQMLVKDQYHGFINGARMVYRTGGILAFYEGLSASLVQMGPAVGISFGTFSVLQPFLLQLLADTYCEGGVCAGTGANKFRAEHVLLASSVAGSVAGFVSKTLTYPFDLAKRRLQIATHDASSGKFKVPTTAKKLFRCHSLPQCIIKTVQSEGFMGLYRGWGITIFKAQLTSVMAFTSYEMMCFVLRELD